jgi:hypothetical protein
VVVAPRLYSGFPKELPKAVDGEIQKIVQYTASQVTLMLDVSATNIEPIFGTVSYCGCTQAPTHAAELVPCIVKSLTGASQILPYPRQLC